VSQKVLAGLFAKSSILELLMKTIDCRGLACPGPVIQVKKTMEELSPGLSFAIDVDSVASRDNVSRFAQGKGAQVLVDETESGTYRLTITLNESTTAARTHPEPVVFLTSDTLGDGDDKLGRILMEGFLDTLQEQETIPDKVLLMNAGVKLAVEGSPTVESIKLLTDRGCEILVCGTCLDFFSLKDKLAVGVVSNMYDIQAVLLTASSVIRP
jgi:selenium metabolism protein YedF